MNHTQLLERLTGLTAWDSLDGPDSGIGVDYWYGTSDGDHEASLNVDQEAVVVAVDGETLWEGTVEEAEVTEARNFLLDQLHTKSEEPPEGFFEVGEGLEHNELLLELDGNYYIVRFYYEDSAEEEA